jgi:hypothetical protein
MGGKKVNNCEVGKFFFKPILRQATASSDKVTEPARGAPLPGFSKNMDRKTLQNLN